MFVPASETGTLGHACLLGVLCWVMSEGVKVCGSDGSGAEVLHRVSKKESV